MDEVGDFVGFDVVIGNPPYISAIELKKQVGDNEYNLYKKIYATAKGTTDIYVYFFELGTKILRQDNFLCYITPNRYLSANYAIALRKYLIDNFQFIKIGDYSNVKVFSETATYPIITLIHKLKNKGNYNFKSFSYIDETSNYCFNEFSSDNLNYLNDNILGFVLSSKFSLTKKL
ncbi:type II restriction-modification [Beggiatoa sp. PS]|nr:type II restriction-modification [Beggiatoa sp. PS]